MMKSSNNLTKLFYQSFTWKIRAVFFTKDFDSIIFCTNELSSDVHRVYLIYFRGYNMNDFRTYFLSMNYLFFNYLFILFLLSVEFYNGSFPGPSYDEFIINF